MEWLRRRPERVEQRMLTAESLPPVMMPSTEVGEGVSQRSGMAISSVFACVRTLVDAAVLAPLVVYRHQQDGTRQRVDSGKLVDLLEHPAPGLTGPSLTSQLMLHLALWNECLIGKVRQDGQIVSLEALPPDRVTIRIDAGQPKFTYYAPLGQIFTDLTTSDVCWVRGMSLDGLRGTSPIGLCREALGLANALTSAASSSMANGSIPSGILTVQAGPTAQDQANSLRDAWTKRHGGPTKRGTVAVVTGEIGWQPVSMSLADAQFVEQQQMSLAEVARVFGIPPSRVNAQSQGSMTYSNLEAESLQFVTHSLAPRLTLIESAVSADPDLCTGPMYVEYLLDGVLRGDSLSRAQFYTLASNPATGWMTRAEIRQRENLPREEHPPALAPDAAAQAPNLGEVLRLSKVGGTEAAG